MSIKIFADAFFAEQYRIIFNSHLQNILKLQELQISGSSFFHSLITQRKRKFLNFSVLHSRVEAYSESSQIPKMEHFKKVYIDFQKLTIFAKSSFLDVWLGS